VGVGPTWTLNDFKGPNSAGSVAGSLLNLGRTDTHQVWLSFAPDPAAEGIIKKMAIRDAAIKAIADFDVARSRDGFGLLSESELLSRRNALVAAVKPLEADLKKEQDDTVGTSPPTIAGTLNSMLLQNLTGVGASH
jgi:hypothetical protein